MQLSEMEGVAPFIPLHPLPKVSLRLGFCSGSSWTVPGDAEPPCPGRRWFLWQGPCPFCPSGRFAPRTCWMPLDGISVGACVSSQGSSDVMPRKWNPQIAQQTSVEVIIGMEWTLGLGLTHEKVRDDLRMQMSSTLNLLMLKDGNVHWRSPDRALPSSCKLLDWRAGAAGTQARASKTWSKSTTIKVMPTSYGRREMYLRRFYRILCRQPAVSADAAVSLLSGVRGLV